MDRRTTLAARGGTSFGTVKTITAVLLLAVTLAAQSADDYLQRARAAAIAKDYRGAAEALQLGIREYPRDARFPAELAALAFTNKESATAKHWVRRALSISPDDEYTNQLAGTLYLQDGNLEAALKFWNRAGWPRVEHIVTEPPVAIDPVLLDRALTVAPASVVVRDEFLRSERQLRHLNLLAGARLELAPGTSDDFNLRLRAREHAGWRTNPKVAAARLLRGLPSLTIFPEVYDVGGSSSSVMSMVRFDPRRARLAIDVTRPWKRDPSWRFGVLLDARDEDWDVREPRSLEAISQFTMRTLRAGPTLSKVLSATCEWSTSVEFTRTTFRSGSAPSVAGSGVANRHEAGCDILRIPERRLNVRADSRLTIARLWDENHSRFVQVQPSLKLDWLPQARGTDYHTQLALHGGATAGDLPLNGLFVLGTDRDDFLPLRAHRAATHRRKGRAPLARSFVLANAEIDKNVYKRGFVQTSIGPFLDAAQVWESVNARNEWFTDAGLQLKFRVFGEFTLSLAYGWDLRNGRGAFSVRSSR